MTVATRRRKTHESLSEEAVKHSGVEPASSPRALSRAKWNAAFAVLAIIGLLIASYPAISQWFSDHRKANIVTGYAEDVQRAGSRELLEVREAARGYNAAMPEVLLSDPYSKSDAREGVGGAWELYRQQLRVDGSEMMARVTVPAVGIDVPVFHGTDDATLQKGAGHLFGSSLPVGGPSTHSVITAHTALTESKMFDTLGRVVEGDHFTISVAGETLVYRADQITTVLPHEIGNLITEPGRDLVTLVTCTPYAVNTHRLLVRGERVSDTSEIRIETIVSDDGSPGFPWWTTWTVGGSAMIAGFAIWASRSRSLERPSSNEASGSPEDGKHKRDRP